MAESLQEHWRQFWQSGPENLYTYLWWAIFTATFGAILMAIFALWYFFVAFLAVAVLAGIATFLTQRYKLRRATIPNVSAATEGSEAKDAELLSEIASLEDASESVRTARSVPLGPPETVPVPSELNPDLPASDPEAEKAAEHLLASGASSDAMGLFTREDFKKFDRLYAMDKRRNIITFKPQIDTGYRNADALLLIVYGYRMLMNTFDVTIHQAFRSLWESGYRRERTLLDPFAGSELDVDEVSRGYIARGCLRKHGLSRGGVFSLTDSGVSKAKDLIEDIYSRLD